MIHGQGQEPYIPNMPAPDYAVVSPKGAARWQGGHPWIFRSDVVQKPEVDAGAVLVRDIRNKDLGWALWSPRSEIALRLLERDTSQHLSDEWWFERIRTAIRRRDALSSEVTAYRLVHGEADGLPSLVCDRYENWLVTQFMSAGIEKFRDPVVAALREITAAEGILARNDVPLRSREGLRREVALLHGSVPEHVKVREYSVRYFAAPYSGQKTGAFLDQRENRRRAGEVARGRALDCFSYHGSFALHLARRAEHVTALDTSSEALARARANGMLNGFNNISFEQADAFDYLRNAEKSGVSFDTIVLDPPAFAKTRSALPAALRGYKEINLRAMRLLSTGGSLLTASCSFHLGKALFIEMLESAAADSGRRVVLRELYGQPIDHPEVLSIPETGYLKSALLEAT